MRLDRRTPAARRTLAALGMIALLPSLAVAHPHAAPGHDFLHGLAHPLLGWDHLLAMLAVGLWAAQRGGRSLWVLPGVFVGVMIAGGALGMAGVSLPGVEGGILASVLVLGALVAAAARPPLAASAGVVALFALFHGHAHGAEMPAASSGAAYGIGFVAATALLHAAGITLALATQRSGAVRRVAWVRAAGAAICVGGLAFWLA